MRFAERARFHGVLFSVDDFVTLRNGLGGVILFCLEKDGENAASRQRLYVLVEYSSKASEGRSYLKWDPSGQIGLVSMQDLQKVDFWSVEDSRITSLKR